MFNASLKLSISRIRINSVPRFVLPNFGHVIGQAGNSKFSAPLVKSVSPYAGIGLSVSCTRLNSCIAVGKDHNSRDIRSHLPEEGSATANRKDDKKKQMDKIGHGNKGRVPWNKGRKHSEETRERISRKTKEALKDPKVRKKMSEAPRVLSKQTKVKIRASLTKLWGGRLRLKRLRERLLRLWGESVALAAKKGGVDQQELEWDGYEKFIQDVGRQNAEEAKMKELMRVRKEREAKAKAMRLAQKKREREENAKARQEPTRKRNKWSKETREKLVEFEEAKLKERLMKIRRKKSTISRVSSQCQRMWEKFDLELVEGKHLQKDISLADQIRVAKMSSRTAA